MVAKKHAMDLNLNIDKKMKKSKITIIGGGVAGMCLVTKLIDNNYPGDLITVLDKGKDPYNRLPEEVMCGGFGAGLFSDGKLTYHTAIGGQLSKYCGEEKAYQLMDQVIQMVTRFHPNPSSILKSDPKAEPDFIKPHFNLRLFPVYHIGSDYLVQIGKNWYDYLIEKGVNFEWETEVKSIDFNKQKIYFDAFQLPYDHLIYATGKSGIDFSQKLIKDYSLETEPKSVQIGVRFEAPQKYFQRLIDISYDFKLYQKFEDVSLRTFCTNNNAAYVAVEETYGNVSYNGHALKDESKRNDMTNFGILMEIKGIDNPFEFSREIVKKSQAGEKGFYYSPNVTRYPSQTSEGIPVKAYQLIDVFHVYDIFGRKYADYIINFISDMNKVFEFENDWGIYIPEVKYLSPEPLVDYQNLALKQYPNVHFVGDALSARGITISGAQGIYVAEYLLS